MRQRPVHPPHIPSGGSSPRSPMISSYSSKKSVPSIPYVPNTIYDQAAENPNQYLIISPIPLNRINKSQKPGLPPVIVKPKADQNQKRGKDKSSDRIPKRSANLNSLSGRDHDLNRKYQNEIQEIESLMNQLILKHPENEDYYRKHYQVFLKVLNEAAATNYNKIPIVINATKYFFEGLLNSQFVRHKYNFRLEEKLRKIISKENINNENDAVLQEFVKEVNEDFIQSESMSDDFDNENQNGKNSARKDEDANNGHNKDDDNDSYLDKLDKSTRNKYEKEIKEIRNLMNQLIKKHPENEDYYRKLFDSFMNAVKKAEQNNPSAIPEIIQATKNAFESLLKGQNGKLDYDLDKKLQSIADDNYLSKLDRSTRDQYGKEIGEVRDLMNQLIKKHPENEDYYRKLFDSFMNAIKKAEQNNPSAIPEIIKSTKAAFENLLKGQQNKISIDFDDKLQSIIDDNYLDKLDKTTKSKYGKEIGEIRDLMNQLIKKHPENEDYYRKLFESFMKAIKKAEKNNPSAISEIVQATKTVFEYLLNSEQDKLDYDLDKKLQSIADDNYLSKLDKSTRDQYGKEIEEVRDLMNQLIKKHPENEDYYRKLFDSFMNAIKKAEQNNPSAIPEIIKTTKSIFEDLLKGKQDKLDFNLDDKLQSIIDDHKDDKYLDELDQSTQDQYGKEIGEVRDLMNQLIKKHPENEDYYRKMFDSFMNSIKEAEKTNPSSIPEIIQTTKTAFEELLNGNKDKLDYNIEDKLKLIVNGNKSDNKLSSTTKFPQLGEDPDEDGNEQGGTKKPSNEIEEIEQLLQKLIEKHPENEDFYRKLFDAFMGVIKEAAAANSPDVPGLAHVTKLFFEELLNGDHDKIDFNIEDKLREILSSVRSNKNDNDNDNENDNENSDSQYVKEIGEVRNLVQKLIDKHPENEDYYRKLLESFLRVIKEAEETNNPAAPEIIQAIKSILENLLNDDQNDRLDFDLEDRLRSILNSSSKDDNGDVDDKYLDELDKATQDQYGKEIGEVRDLMNQLIKKHPENEDYYRKMFDSFMNSIKEAEKTNPSSIPEIIQTTKTAFEELLNGNKDKLDYNLEDKLKSIVNGNDDDDQSNEKKPSNEIEEIEQLLQKLIEKHPENEDFYRKLFDAFMGVIKEAAAANSPDVPGLAHVTKLFFEELLNGDHDKIDFNIEDKLREILSSVRSNKNDTNSNNENENENDSNENDNENSDSQYGKEIGEVRDLMNQLIDKHPENEDYYRKLFDAFMRVIKEAEEANNPAAQEIARVAKSIFEDLLNGDQDQLDYDLEDRLRSILDKSDDKKEVENLLQKLIDKHPENEDYYRKLYEAFMRIIKEAEDSNDPAAPEIARVAKSIFEDLLNGDKDKLDFDLEEKLRSISDGLYKPYNEIGDENEEEDSNKMTDEMILREAEKISSQKVGTKFEKLYPPPRATTLNKRSGTVPNYQTIINALKFTSLPGPRHTELVENLINQMKESKEERFVLLMASRTQKFKGIYILAEDSLSARKMWGQGPNEVKNEDCSIFYKYLNGQKQFDILEIKAFTPTTDGFSLKKKLEPDSW